MQECNYYIIGDPTYQFYQADFCTAPHPTDNLIIYIVLECDMGLVFLIAMHRGGHMNPVRVMVISCCMYYILEAKTLLPLKLSCLFLGKGLNGIVSQKSIPLSPFHMNKYDDLMF